MNTSRIRSEEEEKEEVFSQIEYVNLDEKDRKEIKVGWSNDAL